MQAGIAKACLYWHILAIEGFPVALNTLSWFWFTRCSLLCFASSKSWFAKSRSSSSQTPSLKRRLKGLDRGWKSCFVLRKQLIAARTPSKELEELLPALARQLKRVFKFEEEEEKPMRRYENMKPQVLFRREQSCHASFATRNKCIATRNNCLTTSNKDATRGSWHRY